MMMSFLVTQCYKRGYLKILKISHHVHRKGVEIPMLIYKREGFAPLDFMKI